MFGFGKGGKDVGFSLREELQHGVKVDPRYALREELEEVKEDVKRIKEDTLELKTIGNFIKWIVVVSIPLIPIITSVVEEVKDSAITNQVENKVEEQNKIIQIEGKPYLVTPDGKSYKLNP